MNKFFAVWIICWLPVEEGGVFVVGVDHTHTANVGVAGYILFIA